MILKHLISKQWIRKWSYSSVSFLMLHIQLINCQKHLYYICNSSAKFWSGDNFQKKIVLWSFLFVSSCLAEVNFLMVRCIIYYKQYVIKTKPHSTLVELRLIQYVFLHNATHGFLPSIPGSHGGFVYIVSYKQRRI